MCYKVIVANESYRQYRSRSLLEKEPPLIGRTCILQNIVLRLCDSDCSQQGSKSCPGLDTHDDT